MNDTRTCTWLAAFVPLSLVGGCSSFDFTFDLECQSRPLPLGAPLDDYADPCAALNAKEGIDLERDCEVYQCRPDGRGCERRPQDLDGDGAASAALCGTIGGDGGDGVLEGDCDDRDPRRSYEAKEVCDGIDNDCDGRVDEDLPWAAHPFPAPPRIEGELHDLDATLLDADHLLVTSTHGEVGLDFRTEGLLYGRSGAVKPGTRLGSNQDSLASVAVSASEGLLLGVARGTAPCGKLGQLWWGVVPARADDVLSGAWNWRVHGASEDAPNAGCGAPGGGRMGDPVLATRRGMKGGTADGLLAWTGSGIAHALSLRATRTEGASRASLALARPTPLQLGMATGPLSVTSWTGQPSGGGYLVAFASAECGGGVAAHVLPSGTDPLKPLCLTNDQRVQHVATGAATSNESGPNEAPYPPTLAVTWRSGRQVWFSQLRVRGKSLSASTPQRLSKDATAGPVLSHVAEDPVATSSAQRTRGWMILWYDASTQQLILKRIADQRGGEGETHSILTQRAPPQHLFLVTLPGSAESTTNQTHFFGAATQKELRVGTVSCSAR